VPSTFFIPIEVFRRELDSKIVLATYLTSKGAQVVVGHKWYVNSLAFKNAHQGDVYIHNHTIASSERSYFLELRKRGVLIVSYEDEAVFDTSDYKAQVIKRSQIPGFSDIDMWLCWGSRDYAALQSLGVSPKVLKNIGTPRSVLWGPFGKNLYREDINSRIEPMYKKFILIISSLQAIHIQRNFKTIMNLNSKNSEFNQNEIDFAVSKKNLVVEHAKFNIIKKTISHILSGTSNNIVLRPYGNVVDKHWNELISLAPKRIFVDNRLSITPLISASHVVLHTGSTVAIEALCHGKKAITLAGLNENLFDANLYSNQLSNHVRSFEELDKLLVEDKDNSHEILDSVTDPGNQIFFERFITELQKINFKIVSYKTRDLKQLPKRRIFLYELFGKIRRSPTLKYDSEKRPKVSKRQVGNVARVYSNTISNSQIRPKISKLAPSTFLIRNRLMRNITSQYKEKK